MGPLRGLLSADRSHPRFVARVGPLCGTVSFERVVKPAMHWKLVTVTLLGLETRFHL